MISHFLIRHSQKLPSQTDSPSSVPELALGVHTEVRGGPAVGEPRLLGSLGVNGQARAWLSGKGKITIFSSCAGSLCGDGTQWHW